MENVLKTVDNVLRSHHKKIIIRSQGEKQISSSILQSLDQLAEKLGIVARKLHINETIKLSFSQPNVALAVVHAKPNLLEISGRKNANNSLTLDILNAELKAEKRGLIASARIPAETFRNQSQVVYSFLFKDDILFQTSRRQKGYKPGELIESVVSSKILAVTFFF